MTDAVYVNSRYVGRPRTGVERLAEEVVTRLGTPVRAVAPSPRVPGGPAGHAWEQTVLPRRAPGLLWSPCNTGPVRHRRHVVTIHDTAPLLHPEWFTPAFARLYGRLLPALGRRAAMVVTGTDLVARELHRLGVDHARLAVVGCGVPAWCRPATDVERAATLAALDLRERYVVVVASPEPRKNLARLAAAWERADLRDAQLVVVGAAAARVFREVQLRPGTVRVLGRVDDVQLRAVLSGAVGLASVSLYEGFGLPPIEALACGAPVLVSDIGAHREVLAGFDAVYVDPLDVDSIAAGLRRFLAAPPAADPAAVMARHSWDRAAGAYDEIFASLAG